MIHQSQVDGKPPYIEHVTMCIKKSVTEKSKHFLDFSTMIASNIALFKGKWSGEQMIVSIARRCDVTLFH